MLFAVGDFVVNQKTGHSGKVVGYGHEMVNGAYLPTIIVRVVGVTRMSAKGFVEDLSSLWVRIEEDYTPDLVEVSQTDALATALDSKAPLQS